MDDARNRGNVLVGAPEVKSSGGVLIGDVAKDPKNYPKDAATPLSEELGLKPAGFISEDGITKTVNRSTEKIKDWNKDTVIVVETEHDVTLKLTFLESVNAEVLKAVHGTENVTIGEDGKITVTDSAGVLPHKTFSFEMKGNAETPARLFIPDGQVTSVGDIVFVKSDVIKYEVEIECFADKSNKKTYFFADVKAAEDEDEDDSGLGA